LTEEVDEVEEDGAAVEDGGGGGGTAEEACAAAAAAATAAARELYGSEESGWSWCGAEGGWWNMYGYPEVGTSAPLCCRHPPPMLLRLVVMELQKDEGREIRVEVHTLIEGYTIFHNTSSNNKMCLYFLKRV
jgi:hypothetical protein